MKALLQRVSSASVLVEGSIISEIKNGLLVFLGIENTDTEEDILWLSHKIINLRIFDDVNGVPNLSVKETNGDILLVSQFTLHAQTKKGNRPSYSMAGRPEVALPLYHQFIEQTAQYLQKKIFTGKFGADMKVALVNDGPLTIIIDTKNKV